MSRAAVVELDLRAADPLLLWQRLHPRPRHGFFFGAPAAGAGRLLFSISEPDRVHPLSVDAPDLWRSVRTALARSADPAPRFVGLLHFDAGRAFDAGLRRLPRVSRRDSVGWLADFSELAEWDPAQKTIRIWSRRGMRAAARSARRVERASASLETVSDPASGRAPFRRPSYPAFRSAVDEVKRAIGRGDLYQANVSVRFDGPFRGSAVDLYRRLGRINPSPYACLLKEPGAWIVSCSPELLVDVRGRAVRTRPIAGTRPVTGDEPANRRRRGALLLSPKERAEHIMLVDLERNDLGRVCEPGSVTVSQRCVVERYSHVMHIVSEVRGRLRKRASALDALAAVFPGGTITGCPKIAAVQLIERLERESRGPFYGSAGWIAGNGDAVFNILIRTAVVKGGRLAYRAGAGIVADSRPAREYAEVLAKGRAILDAAGGRLR